MQVVAYKTKKVAVGDSVFDILLESLPENLPNNAIIAVTSKIIAICERRVMDPLKKTRDEITEDEAELYLPREKNPFDVCISIKNSTFIASGGVDQSNGNGQYVLWPKDVQRSANEIREFLSKHFNLKNIGVIVTDSRLSPLRWGVTGVCLSHSGFEAIRSYIGKPDVFGRLLRVEKVNDADSLAAAAVVVMGEGDEQTPLAVITDVSFVTFTGENPSDEESLTTMGNINHDIFSPLMTSVNWKKGKAGR